MSFLKYFFDNDRRQRADIEELRETQHRMASSTAGGGASQRWVAELEDEVKELAATVNVLMRKLAYTGQLDIAAVQREVEGELHPRGRTASCHKCSAQGETTAMVRVGADWLCRSCARNP